MLCQEIMKRDVKCVAPTDSVQVAARLMRDENIGFVPVCDERKHVLGTITDRDLAIRILADGKASTVPVSEAMSHDVVSCRPDDELRRAEALLARNKKSRIMIVADDDSLVGVISLSDIAQVDDQDAHVAKTLRRVTEREAAPPGGAKA